MKYFDKWRTYIYACKASGGDAQIQGGKTRFEKNK